MKYLEIRNIKKVSALGVLGIVTFSPVLGAPQSAQAAPPDHAPAHGWRRNQSTTVRPNANTRVRLRGTVVEDRGGDDFVIRTDSGQRILVRAQDEPSDLNTGDRVVVRGDYSGSTFIARRVRVTNDANFDWNDDYNNDWDDNGWDNDWDGQRVTVRGVVTRDLWDNDEFEIRADNGRTYRVNLRTSEPRRLSKGDRVEVVGDVNGNNIRATTLRIVTNNNGGWNNGTWGSTLLSGVITRDLNGNRFEIRTTDGRTVQVIAPVEPNRLSRGDRVQVRGRFDGSLFRATTVTLTDTNGGYNSGYNTGYGSRVNFSGVVTNVQSSTRFSVRGDNGRTYNVQTTEVPRRIDTGDRVRVQGTVGYGGLIRSTNLDLLNNYNTRDRRDNDYSSRDGDDLDFRGTIVSSQLLGAILTVRADNGREYRVRSSISGLRAGDRVRVRGEWNGNLINNASITRL